MRTRNSRRHTAVDGERWRRKSVKDAYVWTTFGGCSRGWQQVENRGAGAPCRDDTSELCVDRLGIEGRGLVRFKTFLVVRKKLYNGRGTVSHQCKNRSRLRQVVIVVSPQLPTLCKAASGALRFFGNSSELVFLFEIPPLLASCNLQNRSPGSWQGEGERVARTPGNFLLRLVLRGINSYLNRAARPMYRIYSLCLIWSRFSPREYEHTETIIFPSPSQQHSQPFGRLWSAVVV